MCPTWTKEALLCVLLSMKPCGHKKKKPLLYLPLSKNSFQGSLNFPTHDKVMKQLYKSRIQKHIFCLPCAAPLGSCRNLCRNRKQWFKHVRYVPTPEPTHFIVFSCSANSGQSNQKSSVTPYNKVFLYFKKISDTHFKITYNVALQ